MSQGYLEFLLGRYVQERVRMRRIVFNEETVGQIRNFLEVEHHTIEETCNRFTIKKDTLHRVMREHNISCGNPNKVSNIRLIDEETKQKAYRLSKV